MEFFSPTQENKRLGLFSPLQFGLVQSYEVEWRTCRANSALLKRIKGLQMAQRLGFFSPLQYWTLLVLQNRMESLQSGPTVKNGKACRWLCSLDFSSPLQYGFFGPMK